MTEMDDRTAWEGDSNVFDLTRRGYDRRQVDDHVQSLLVQLAETEQARQREEGRANRAEAEVAHAHERLRAQIAAGDTQRLAIVAPAGRDVEPAAEASWSHAGFGMRLEKLLRAAEQEAARTRQSATREAHALLEQARGDAEVHRHEVEQALIARTTEIDQKAARRKVELDERERHIGEQSAAAQQESEQVVADAQRRAEELSARAREEAEDLLARAEEEIAERETASAAELGRLERMQHGVRGDLGRLMQSLAAEFDRRAVDDEARGERAERATARVIEGSHRPPREDAAGSDGAVGPGTDDVDEAGVADQPDPYDEDEDDDGELLVDGDSGTLTFGSVGPSGWFGRPRVVADAGARPPPGPSHLRRTGHGGHGRADGGESRSRWFGGSAEADDPGPTETGATERGPTEPGHTGSAHVDLRRADSADSAGPAGPAGPAGLPGPVSPVGSMSLAGPVGRLRLSGPIGGIGPVGPVPGR